MRMRRFRSIVTLALVLGALPSIAHAADVYRRWLAPKTYTCSTGPSNVTIAIDNQNVEFNNLPADAQFTIGYIVNGAATTDGPYPVEQTSGTKSYGSFGQNFPAYPATFDFRLDTIVGGFVVYRSTLSISCSADGSGDAPITNVEVPTTGPFTGSWTGKWSCKALDNGEKRKTANTSSTFKISGGDTLAADLDGSRTFAGATVLDGKKPESQATATVTDCRTSPGVVVPVHNEVISLTAKTTPTKGKLTGTSVFLTDDGTDRVVGTCKYKYKRTSSGDPTSLGCVN